jgi:hypothetical protein
VELPAPDARDPAARGARRGARDHPRDIFSPEFLIRRPLLQALEATSDGEPPLLLIDEIDRADEEFEAYLLELLSRLRRSPSPSSAPSAPSGRRASSSPATGRARSTTPSSGAACTTGSTTRRRAKELAIVHARLPEVPERLASQVVGFIGTVSGRRTWPSCPAWPRRSTGRPRSWPSAPRELESDVIDETLGVVLKYEEDVRSVRGATARGYLDEVVARG